MNRTEIDRYRRIAQAEEASAMQMLAWAGVYSAAILVICMSLSVWGRCA